MKKILKGDIYEQWKVVDPDSGKRQNTEILCKCKCLICNNIQLIRATYLRHNTLPKCKSCRQIYLDSVIGKKFNMLMVISYFSRDVKNRDHIYNCKCDCGNITQVRLSQLISNGTKSCGCLKYTANKIHGLSNTRIYSIYIGMKDRCYNKNNHAYDYYGGRGIYIADEWLGENGFINFYNWSIQNGYRDDLTIDRIDSDGPYSSLNCRWSTWEQQNNNKYSINKYYINSTELSASQISRLYNINYDRLTYLINKNNKHMRDILKDDFNIKISKRKVIRFD